MKKDLWMKRALTFLLASALAVGSTSCTSGDTNKPASDTPESEPIVLNMHRSTTTDNYIDENNPTYQKLHQQALEEANVDLQITYFDWGDNYTQKLTMYAASGDLPSGVWVLGASDMEIINKMGTHGFLYDWTDVVNDTANYPTLMENAGEEFIKMSVCQEDGKLYGFPAETHKAYPHAPGGISLRKDWLEQVNMEYPTNEDELYAVIKAFAEQCTDVNGNPVTPVSFPQWDNFIFWLNSWLGTSMWYQDGDTVGYGKYAKQDQLEAALVFLNKLWNEGLMDQESFTHTTEQFITKGANSMFGVSTFSYAATYSINDSFYAEEPGSDKYFVSCPTFSCYDELPAEEVNSVEIVSSPFNRIAITKQGISENDFKRIVKAIDWIGTYDASLMLLMGFEDEDWYYDEATDRKLRTDEWTQKVTESSTHQYNAGLCYWSSLNSNAQAMYDLLNCICVRPSDVESVQNIQGHQIAVTSAPNVVTAGPVEKSKMTLVEDAWKQMVIGAISAPSEAECRNVVSQWPQTMEDLGYNEIVEEKVDICKDYGLM